MSYARTSAAVAPTSVRLVQLLVGIVCMVMIANLQYGWTLFVNPIDQKYHWGRAAIQVAFALPARNASVKRAPALGNELPDHAVFFDDIVRADAGTGIAQPLQRGRACHHARVMEYQHVDPRRLGAGGMVRRGIIDCL